MERATPNNHLLRPNFEEFRVKNTVGTAHAYYPYYIYAMYLRTIPCRDTHLTFPEILICCPEAKKKVDTEKKDWEELVWFYTS
ncbi:hypothetical protein TWF106_006002 [Orbilia oligospora]|uniref:Uncharacterized protein n=1 Tax=Orbilia oligospora TaxID=2813651 RepID=A0A7C8V427_ORBOL|nr:hypothetical protein TWF106_006002 [Orbilia oligospora]